MELRKNCVVDAGQDFCEIFGSDVLNKGKIMQISVAVFNPGQDCPVHKHFDLHEIFACEKGEIDITVDDTTVHMVPNDVLLVRPGHNHSLINKTSEICQLLIMGIACPE